MNSIQEESKLESEKSVRNNFIFAYLFSLFFLSNVCLFSQNANEPEIAAKYFILINAETNEEIRDFFAGDVINLALDGKNLNLKAVTKPDTVGSVKFSLNEKKDFSTDNTAPYALAGDTKGDYNSWKLAVGNYSITATPYSDANGQGNPGTPRTLFVTVADEKKPACVSFSLINADTNKDIRFLNDNDIINPAVDGQNLNIRANTTPKKVGSLVFSLNDKSLYRAENVAPYALEGDTSGIYEIWPAKPGKYTMTATPYSERSASGTAGKAKTIKFTVQTPVK